MNFINEKTLPVNSGVRKRSVALAVCVEPLTILFEFLSAFSPGISDSLVAGMEEHVRNCYGMHIMEKLNFKVTYLLTPFFFFLVTS